MMSNLNVSDISDIKEFERFDKKKVIVVHFYADWSEECKHMNCLFDVLSNDPSYKNLVFKKCAAEELPEISKAYDVTAVPTILLFKSGVLIDKLIGADPAALTERIQELAPDDFLRGAEPEKFQELLADSPVLVCVRDDEESNKLIQTLNKTNIKFKKFEINSDENVKKRLEILSKSSNFPQIYFNGEYFGDSKIINTITSLELERRAQAAEKKLNLSLVNRMLSLINKSNVMVFMKGEKDAPKCGFSLILVEILKGTGTHFETFDILTDEDIRQGLKVLMDWPTYPQVYVKGEFIGGLDIIKSLKENGELNDTLSA